MVFMSLFNVNPAAFAVIHYNVVEYRRGLCDTVTPAGQQLYCYYPECLTETQKDTVKKNKTKHKPPPEWMDK